MADFTLRRAGVYPEGTTVEAYPLTNWPGGNVRTDAAPPGSATESQVVTDGDAAFTELTEGTRYVAYAQVAFEHRYVGPFLVAFPPDPAEQAELDAVEAKIDALAEAYSLVHRVSGYIGAGATVGDYVAIPTAFAKFDANFTALGMFGFDPADHPAPDGKELQLKLVVDYIVQGTPPGATPTFQFGVYEVDPENSAEASIVKGTLVTGSQPATIGPLNTALAEGKVKSADFDAPAAERYAFGCVLAGASTAASSMVEFSVALFRHYVDL